MMGQNKAIGGMCFLYFLPGFESVYLVLYVIRWVGFKEHHRGRFVLGEYLWPNLPPDPGVDTRHLTCSCPFHGC